MKENNFILKKGIIKKKTFFFFQWNNFLETNFLNVCFFITKKNIPFIFLDTVELKSFVSLFFFLRIVDRETLYSKNIDFVDFICNLHGYMYM